jgi:calmodulin
MLFVDDEPSLQEVKMAFSLFDENNDGYINASDLQRVLRGLGLEGVGLNECEQMIARYDMNKDTRIDFMEFTNVLEASFC